MWRETVVRVDLIQRAFDGDWQHRKMLLSSLSSLFSLFSLYKKNIKIIQYNN